MGSTRTVLTVPTSFLAHFKALKQSGFQTMSTPAFSHLSSYPGDPILGLVETFKADVRSNKINLSIGYYYDEQGSIPKLRSVVKAAALNHSEDQNDGYLPMAGSQAFIDEASRLVFGEDSHVIQQRNVASVQTLGGSGALKLGADFLKAAFPDCRIYVSDPTWDNHIAIFEGAGLVVDRYPYLRQGTLAIDQLRDVFATAARGSVFVMQPCGHNPTGIDPTAEQWEQILGDAKRFGHILFMDMAYMGFGKGVEEDVAPVRIAAAMGITMLVSTSFSKNFSVYSERLGMLGVVCSGAEESQIVLGRLKALVRSNYSSPPRHGAAVVTSILSDPELHSLWKFEIAGMRARIQRMRQLLASEMQTVAPDVDVSFLLTQNGMFSYTGLSVAQVDTLRREFAIYLLSSGRMCLPGLTERNIKWVAQGLARVMSKQSKIEN